ncbi:pyridoxamine 5'-phosphate oxidase family protein, partial [Streptomyces scabiei]|nr:pyridoxamine 5'-phosphate oxidase family protein [Streptomyces scabiei]
MMPISNHHQGAAVARRSVDLDSDEALRLLGTVSFGRIVFTR